MRHKHEVNNMVCYRKVQARLGALNEYLEYEGANQSTSKVSHSNQVTWLEADHLEVAGVLVLL